MNYLIDFDKLEVLAKATNNKTLQSFVDKNELSLAVAVIKSLDELTLQFTISEMGHISNYFGNSINKWNSEEEAARHCWSHLESNKYPSFNSALGKKIATPEPEKKRRSSTSRKAKTPIIDGIHSMIFVVGKTPLIGKALKIIEGCIEDNLDEANYNELLTSLINEYSISTAKNHILKALHANCIEETI